jgi:hypothetical protein
MMQKIMKCGFIGGFILFIWGAVAWTILPWQMNQFKTFSDEKDVRFTIRDNAPESGLYLLPSLHNASSDERAMEAKKQMREGPVIFASVNLEGKSPSVFGSSVAALITKVVAACIVAAFLCRSHLDYNRSVKFITGLGFIIGMMASIPYVIWFGFPGMFAISCIIESTIGWFFAGLAMSRVALVKPAK